MSRLGSERGSEAGGHHDRPGVVEALLHSRRRPEHRVPERDEQQPGEQQARKGQPTETDPYPRRGANRDQVQQDRRVPVPAEDLADQSVEHGDAGAVRSERREPGRIGDLADRVVAAAEAGLAEGERLVPVGDLVVDGRTVGGDGHAEECVHQSEHENRYARHAEERCRSLPEASHRDRYPITAELPGACPQGLRGKW